MSVNGARGLLVKKIKRQYQAAAIVLLFAALAGVMAIFLMNTDLAVLTPKGTIAADQRNLMIIGTLLSVIVVVPVFVLTFFIVWKYRASNKKAKYSPDWDHSRVAETIWWAVPLALIVVLSVITWKSSHELDPYKPLESDKRPLTIQVVALEWKWLFIYPEHNIATVNYFRIPEDTPINFEITSDAPMNSFWIPQLGGQVYAMSGMKTKLHLEASEVGSYNGSSANLSGEGFAGMKFIAEASTQADFEKWLVGAKQSPDALSLDVYNQLATPSQNNPRAFFSPVDADLYDTVIMKYMMPGMREERTPHHKDGH